MNLRSRSAQACAAAAVVAVMPFLLPAADEPSSADDAGVRVVPLGEVTAPAHLQREATKALREALKKRIRIDLKNATLENALQELQDRSGVKSITLDVDGEVLADLPVELRVTFESKDMTLGQVLHHILAPHDLAWVLRDETLFVTSQYKVDDIRETRVYDVHRLLDVMDAEFSKQPKIRAPWHTYSYESPYVRRGGFQVLINVLQQETSGPWQAINGDGGTISQLSQTRTLAVRQTRAVHEDVAAILHALGLFSAGKLNYGMAEIWPEWVPQEDVVAARRCLAREVPKLRFDGAELRTVISSFEELCGRPILIDRTALQEDGIALDEKITATFENIALQSAMDRVLRPQNLVCTVDHGVLCVTTQVKADDQRRTVVYDARDLVDRRTGNNQPLINLLQQETSGPWQAIDGDGGTNSATVGGCFVIRQTDKVHREIALLFEDLRRPTEAAPEAPAITREERLARIETRFYGTTRKGVAAQLESALTELVAPETWKSNGGPGTVRQIGETLIVRQSVKVHEQIEAFLRELKTAEEMP